MKFKKGDLVKSIFNVDENPEIYCVEESYKINHLGKKIQYINVFHGCPIQIILVDDTNKVNASHFQLVTSIFREEDE